MKSFRTLFVTLLSLFILSGTLLAQNPGMRNNMQGQRHHPKMMGEKMGPGIMLPGLSEKQKSEIKKIHLAQMQSTQTIRNQIMEKKAHLHTLQTADKVNMRAINASIDEISALKTQMAKKRAATRQKIRSLLTDEQRIVFDNRPMGKKGGPGHGMRKDCKRCMKH